MPPRPTVSEARQDRTDSTRPGIVTQVRDALASRADGWINALTGFGGPSDRTEATTYGATLNVLQWPQLTSMFLTEDLSAKIVDVYPREALRLGFQVGGLDGADQADVQRYITKRLVTKRGVYLPLRGAIWGRLYGSSALWLGSKTANPELPMVPGEAVDFMRVVDDRYLRPAGLGWENLDDDGEPMVWTISHPTNPQGRTMRVHESRLILFPGATTDDLTRVSRGFRDISVLQRAYNALRSEGTVWKATETLIGEASVGVMKIKNLFSLVTSGQRDNLTERLRLANLGRTLNRSMVLDADKEDYTRVQQTFAGIPDLTDRAIKRVAAAAEIPVTVLMGEAPAGLNATGDADLRWFFARIQAYRTQGLEPLLEKLVRILLAQPDSPFKAKASEATIVWPPLWEPTAAERAQIRLQTSQADELDRNAGILTAEEIRASRFTDDGYSQDTHLDDSLGEDLEATSADDARVAGNAAAGPAVLAAVVAQAVTGAIPKSAAMVIIAMATDDEQAADMLKDVPDEPPEPEEPASPAPGELPVDSEDEASHTDSMRSDEFSEADHPRAENGQFGAGSKKGRFSFRATNGTVEHNLTEKSAYSRLETSRKHGNAGTVQNHEGVPHVQSPRERGKIISASSLAGEMAKKTEAYAKSAEAGAHDIARESHLQNTLPKGPAPLTREEKAAELEDLGHYAKAEAVRKGHSGNF